MESSACVNISNMGVVASHFDKNLSSLWEFFWRSVEREGPFNGVISRDDDFFFTLISCVYIQKGALAVEQPFDNRK